MSKLANVLLAFAVVLSLAATAVWGLTGRHYYTKFQVVERVEVPIDPADPLAAAGFYDDNVREETVRRDEFHLGLLPTPSGIFDKHVVSVATLVGPPWLATAVALWLSRRRRRVTTDAKS